MLPESSMFQLNEETLPSEKVCQTRDLFVLFKDLNWQNWVIAPDGYNANFCQGICEFPMPSEMNATNHAYVQDLVQIFGAITGDGELPPSPSCAPQELATVSVLYYDYTDNVVLKKFRQMIVKSCACV